MEMFKRFLVVAMGLAVGLLLSASMVTSQAGEGGKLVVYTYSSFAAYGPAKFIETEFEKRFNIDVVFVATGASREMLSRLIAEKRAGRIEADVFVGVEAADTPRAKKRDLFEPLTEKDVPLLLGVPPALRFDPAGTLIPYEHGFVTLVHDSKALSPDKAPKTFEALTDPKLKDTLIVQDPRTSSVGYAFLLWTIAQYGDPGYLDYWKRLKPTILTIPLGWSEAYAMFLAGEAPMVVSFSTDNAFDQIFNNQDRIKVLLLNDQGYRTIFGMGVVKGTDNPKMAREFLNFMLSKEVQEKLPTTEWMFPVHPEAQLPERFRELAVIPPNPVVLPLEEIEKNGDRWLKEWERKFLGD